MISTPRHGSDRDRPMRRPTAHWHARHAARITALFLATLLLPAGPGMATATARPQAQSGTGASGAAVPSGSTPASGAPASGAAGPKADPGGETAAQAQAAAAALKAAVADLGRAKTAADRVAALTRTIRAYESGLAALRAGLRGVAFREAALRRQFTAKRAELSRLLGALSAIAGTPEPVTLAGPEGPLDTIRSGMIISAVAPGLHARVAILRGQLKELAALRAQQQHAEEILRKGMVAVQQARTDLSQAISNRTDLPRRFTESPAELTRLAKGVTTLGQFADLLRDRRMPQADPNRDFATAKGTLPLPVRGTVLHAAGQADAAGIRRPGIILATRPRALVTAPWAATIRYVGPLLDYGNVIILEPGGGYLLILAGLGTVYGKVGDVIAAGTPVGLMGGKDTLPKGFVAGAQDAGGAGRAETLYMELRKNGKPVDPGPWFASTKDRTTQ